LEKLGEIKSLKLLKMKIIKIVLCFLTLILNLSCEKNQMTKTEIYNQKANELILQTIEIINCDCISEIPKESMIEISNAENPKYNFKKALKKQLNVKFDSEIDSLISVSKKFKLDAKKIASKKIKIISKINIAYYHNRKSKEILKMCPNGIISMQKPIFNENYTKAVFEYNFTFSCSRELPYPVYEFKNGKWKIENRL
jgi:hypothetical protein